MCIQGKKDDPKGKKSCFDELEWCDLRCLDACVVLVLSSLKRVT